MYTATRCGLRWALALFLAASTSSATAQDAPVDPADDSLIPGTYLLSSDRLHDDGEILWPGFLSGLRGFEGFFEPVGMPMYFESPFNNTSIRVIYLHHEFPLTDADDDIMDSRVTIDLIVTY